MPEIKYHANPIDSGLASLFPEEIHLKARKVGTLRSFESADNCNNLLNANLALVVNGNIIKRTPTSSNTTYSTELIYKNTWVGLEKIAGHPSITSSYFTTHDTELLLIPYKFIHQEECEKNPEFLTKCNQILLKYYEFLQIINMNKKTLPATKQVLSYFAACIHCYTTIDIDSTSITCSQQTLSDAIGIARSTVSNVINKLSALDLLHHGYKIIELRRTSAWDDVIESIILGKPLNTKNPKILLLLDQPSPTGTFFETLNNVY